MASSSSSLTKPGGTLKTVKRLGEFLREQQEPFELDVYLVEKGYSSTRRKERRGHHYPTAATTGCCPRNISDTNLKRFPTCGYGLKLDTPLRVVRNLSIPHQIHPSVPTVPHRNINKLLSVSISSRRRTKSHHFIACHDNGRVGEPAPAPPESKGTTHCPQAEELDRFSSASSSVTVFDSYSARDKQLLVSPTVSVSSSSSQQNNIPSPSAHNSETWKLLNLNQLEAAADRECQWGCIEDGNQQLSPVSGVEEVSSVTPASSLHIHLVNRQNQKAVGFCPRTHREEEEEEKDAASIPIPNQTNNIRVTEDSILSASLWELLLQRPLAQKQGSGGVEAVLKDLLGSQYVKTKRVLQQTRQLLFDCVREEVEKHRWNGTGTGAGRTSGWHGGFDQIIGAEELGKIICDQIRAWGKQSIDVTNLNQLVEADVSETTEEDGWRSSFLKPHSIRNEIGMGIADAILDEISNELVTDMVHIQYLHL
ncbi:hypothetical protein NE237_018611 [Protea cynaroides]|uniref:DUF4378 domain-containing protein n=1 Tax=Protea cynaroides TaxID=273540 RepID=A0A9Q0QP58_9MAGN|nr:hypothetical protein NE237_018611 [Protea cynaroides]